MIQFASQAGGGDLFVEELMEGTQGRAVPAVFDALQHLRAKTAERLSGQRAGREYFVPGEMNATYRASVPGQAPASASGKLRQNVNAEGPTVEGGEVAGRVGVDERVVPYARRLEHGGVHFQRHDQAVRTPSGWFTVKAGTIIRTAPRPFLRPTFDAEKAAVLSMMQQRLDRG